jgi:hypothetical protein
MLVYNGIKITSKCNFKTDSFSQTESDFLSSGDGESISLNSNKKNTFAILNEDYGLNASGYKLSLASFNNIQSNVAMHYQKYKEPL